MSDELRAAAMRISQSGYVWTGNIPVGLGRWTWNPEDAIKLAEIYLAEHPADDDAKLTVEESEKAFGSLGHIDATVSSHRNLVAVKIDDWILLETRGDLRRLLSVLPPF